MKGVIPILQPNTHSRAESLNQHRQIVKRRVGAAADLVAQHLSVSGPFRFDWPVTMGAAERLTMAEVKRLQIWSCVFAPAADKRAA